MKRLPLLSVSSSLALAALLTAGATFAEEGRFDAQTFRPSAAPRDLVMVRKSEIMGEWSPVVGVFTDLAFDPLVLVDKTTDQAINAVSSRLALTAMAGVGLFNWIDVHAALPIIAFQDGGNLRSVGTEGKVRQQALGDLRLEMKLGLPFLHRRDEVKEGFGAALYGNVNFPTGDVMAFAGDGIVTGGAGVILDYRFNFGLLLSANGGVWLRPDRQWVGTRIGNMASFGVGAEMYVLQRHGVSVVGNIYGYPSLVSFPDDPAQVPAEVLLGVRWQSKWGLTVTVGGSFGAACSFGAPAIRLWNSITYQPHTSREQTEINRLMQKDSVDPDKDGLIGDADRCPQAPGRPENQGCPDTDSDGDGVVDREDECPDLASNARGKDGCPGAFVKGDEIVILQEVNFATDKDIILPESTPVLHDVFTVLMRYPEIQEIEIGGHTDVRAGDEYNKALSQRRVNSVMAWLIAKGIDPSRIKAKGYGHSQPVYDDSSCTGPDEELTPTCRHMTSKNRRVQFRILKRGAPSATPLTGANGGGLLPTKQNQLPNAGDGVLPTLENKLENKEKGRPNQGGDQGVLPDKDKGVLPNNGVLKPSDANQLPRDSNLPKADPVLPNQGVLPRAGEKGPPAPSAAPSSPPAPSAAPSSPPAPSAAPSSPPAPSAAPSSPPPPPKK